jgi:hypothetical protein
LTPKQFRTVCDEVTARATDEQLRGIIRRLQIEKDERKAKRKTERKRIK